MSEVTEATPKCPACGDKAEEGRAAIHGWLWRGCAKCGIHVSGDTTEEIDQRWAAAGRFQPGLDVRTDGSYPSWDCDWQY